MGNKVFSNNDVDLPRCENNINAQIAIVSVPDKCNLEFWRRVVPNNKNGTLDVKNLDELQKVANVLKRIYIYIMDEERLYNNNKISANKSPFYITLII